MHEKNLTKKTPSLESEDHDVPVSEHHDDAFANMVQTALDDPRAGIPAKEVFERLQRRHLERVEAANRAS